MMLKYCLLSNSVRWILFVSVFFWVGIGGLTNSNTPIFLFDLNLICNLDLLGMYKKLPSGRVRNDALNSAVL